MAVYGTFRAGSWLFCKPYGPISYLPANPAGSLVRVSRFECAGYKETEHMIDVSGCIFKEYDLSMTDCSYKNIQ
jgi:hypothetical protein